MPAPLLVQAAQVGHDELRREPARGDALGVLELADVGQDACGELGEPREVRGQVLVVLAGPGDLRDQRGDALVEGGQALVDRGPDATQQPVGLRGAQDGGERGECGRDGRLGVLLRLRFGQDRPLFSENRQKTLGSLRP